MSFLMNRAYKKIGIYSGSFNPIHRGHTMLAEQIANSGVVDEVWMLVTPLNPLKQNQLMASNQHRLVMAQIAVKNCPKIFASDFEFYLPQPTFTYTTLCSLRQKYPQHKFTLIIGSDNWLIFTKWRNYQEIIEEFGLIIYPRPGFEVELPSLPDNVILFSDAPTADVSSTQIRKRLEIQENSIEVKSFDKDDHSIIDAGVLTYIRSHHLYNKD